MGVGGEIDCEEIAAHLYTFLDGELDEEACAQIRVHLANCNGCAEVVGFEEELRIVIRSKLVEPCPDALRQRIEQLLAAEADEAS